jgi:hypothetical protein
MGLLKDHIDRKEAALLAETAIAANAGHSVNKGTPREAFIRGFLKDHLSQKVAIGTGELFDAGSLSNEPRHQHDIVLYRSEYPRLLFGGDIHGFLAESVYATIEVKSTLDYDGLYDAIKSANATKALQQNAVHALSTGYVAPSPLAFLVAYAGPASMGTIHSWLPKIHASLGIVLPELPLDETARMGTVNPSIDGVFVLGKGFLYFDAAPIGFGTAQMRNQYPTAKWLVSETNRGALLMLFLLLTSAVSGTQLSFLNPAPYLTDFRPQLRFLP